MAKFTAAPLFETVSGALNKINKKSPHAADQKMVLTTHRKAATTSPDCQRVYLRGLSSVTRNTPVTANETWARGRFVAVAAAVKARKEDLSKITSDNEAFLAQKDQPYGKKTMRSYLWKICGDAWDEQHPRD